MISEPHKIKTVRKIRFITLEERREALRAMSHNTFRIPSDLVTFDMTSQGSGAMSHDQLSGILLGDEAYAGSRNFQMLQAKVRKVIGHSKICPTHNLRGSIKLISSTLVKEGDLVLSNSRTPRALVEERNAGLRLVLNNKSKVFSGNLDIHGIRDRSGSARRVPFIYAETFADGYRPVSLANLKKARRAAESRKSILILDASRIVENALHIRDNEAGQSKKSVARIVREMVGEAHVCVMDAGQDACCNVGGLISTNDPRVHEKFQNEVVVYEGLHTYGGMAGRTMEIFARSLETMVHDDQALWMREQAMRLAGELKGVPLIPGCDGVYLKADKFLPRVKKNTAHALAAALYLKSGVRAFLDGAFEDVDLLPVQLPRFSLSMRQISEIARAIKSLYKDRAKIAEFELTSRPSWHDEARFSWDPPDLEEHEFSCEPHVIHTFEHVGMAARKERERAIKAAGHNTFLLLSKDVTIDLLTDSGTAAMSVEQWQKYKGGVETPASSKDYFDLIDTVRELTGYKYVMPTHQGRAAEHIMSQIMIDGGFVPGNMYFTTTKLHQEMAGGTFVDVIVDEAHQPRSGFQWKGNIDIKKLDALVKEHGAGSFPYVSFEMSVNMAGGQPFSMDNAQELYAYCRQRAIPVMFDATRAAENAYMIRKHDPRYRRASIKAIIQEMFSYGDGCTWSCKKDPLVNIGGLLAFRDDAKLNEKALDMLRKYEGSATSGGMSAGDMAAMAQGFREMIDGDYIRARVEQTQYLGRRLLKAGIPIVEPPGSHAIFLDAKRFLPHIDQERFPAQALSAAIFVESGVRAMERGNVSKGRNPKTGENYRPALELVRLTIPRRAYTDSHMDTVAEGIIAVYKRRKTIKGLRFTYEPKVLRFFQGRFEETRTPKTKKRAPAKRGRALQPA